MQPQKSFFIWNLIMDGWKLMKSQVWQILGLQVLYMIIYCALIGVIGLLLPVTEQAAWYLPTANALACGFVSYCFSMGIITLSLKYADREPVRIGDFFSKLDRILQFLAASILTSLCVIAGLICFIVPGIIVAARFSLFGYFIIDENMGPIEALEASWALVKGVTWRIIGFWLATLIISIAGVLALGIGLLFAFPTTCIAGALVYRTLNNQTHAKIDHLAV